MAIGNSGSKAGQHDIPYNPGYAELYDASAVGDVNYTSAEGFPYGVHVMVDYGQSGTLVVDPIGNSGAALTYTVTGGELLPFRVGFIGSATDVDCTVIA